MVLGVALAVTVAGCSALFQAAGALQNLKRLTFRLDKVRDVRLAGVALGNKSSLQQFSVLDAARLLEAFRRGSLPAELVLEVAAVNPNDGSGGSSRTTSTLTALDGRLLIDGKPTVKADIERAIEIPGTGQATLVPIRLSLDLYEFFGEKRYEDLVNLALALGGLRRDLTRVSIDARPRVTTPLGDITWPGRITIVEKEFR